MIRMLSLVISFLVFLSCNQKELIIPIEDPVSSEITDIRGVSFVSTHAPIDASNFTPLNEINANYVAVIPFAVGPGDNSSLIFNSSKQWKGETAEGIKESIALAREQNLKIMLKPQVWFWNGKYTGHFKLEKENNWIEFEKNYRDYILIFARMAEETQVELFCIGTEFETFVKERPVFWKELIAEIRKIYSGKLTYAGNWDSYKKSDIWLDLDFIGVDAYFPLTNEKLVTEDSAKIGWKRWIDEMELVSKKYKKQIILTEIGYRSIDFSGKEPWVSSGNQIVNLENQRVLYKIMFEEVWNQSFIEGGFIWKWFPDHKNSGGENNLRFTPQNKPAQQELKQQFLEYSKKK